MCQHNNAWNKVTVFHRDKIILPAYKYPWSKPKYINTINLNSTAGKIF